MADDKDLVSCHDCLNHRSGSPGSHRTDDPSQSKGLKMRVILMTILTDYITTKSKEKRNQEM